MPKHEEARALLPGLRQRLENLQAAYYAGRPLVSDLDYDRLFDELLSIEREYPDLVTPDSPSHRVGSDLNADFPERRHSVPALSLDKAYTAEEVVAWMRKVVDAQGRPLGFVAEEKIDGVSILLYYRRGVLDAGVTRGNGFVGNDVTANIKTLRRVPLRLPREIDLAVRGEVFLPVDRFVGLNKTMDEAYANPRNLVAGTLRRNKSADAARVPLDILVYDAYTFPSLLTHRQVLEGLGELGLPTNPRTMLFDSREANFDDAVRDFIRRCSDERVGLGYQIDGLVFKIDELAVRESVGHTGHHPRWALAYKFESPQGVTRLRAIDVQVGRTGRLTPVARIEPVEIGGTTISNATLHNQDYIDQLELAVGDLVSVSRRGDVIPAIEGVVEKGRDRPAYRMPIVCPACGTPLVTRGAHSFCPNQTSCPDQRRGRLAFFVGKSQMDVEHLGPETTLQLLDAGLVGDIPDIYGIAYDRLAAIPGFGQRRIELIQEGIEKSKSQPYERVLPSLGVQELGTKLTELLIAGGFDTIDKLIDAADRDDVESLTRIHGVGEKTARIVLSEIRRPETRRLIDALRAAGLNFQAAARGAVGGEFAGQTWCVTGTFERFKPREKAMDEVRRRGGRVTSAVSGSTTHLLAGEAAGSKLEKARALGVRVVTEAEFAGLVGLP